MSSSVPWDTLAKARPSWQTNAHTSCMLLLSRRSERAAAGIPRLSSRPPEPPGRLLLPLMLPAHGRVASRGLGGLPDLSFLSLLLRSALPRGTNAECCFPNSSPKPPRSVLRSSRPHLQPSLSSPPGFHSVPLATLRIVLRRSSLTLKGVSGGRQNQRILSPTHVN